MAVIILSQDLVRVVYGAGYLQAPLYLAAYSTLFLLTGLGYAVTDNLFNGAGETKLTFKTSIVYLSVFVAAAPALTWVYGVLGLITAHLISNLASTFYALILAHKRFRVKINLQGQIRIYLTSALSAISAVAILNLSSLSILNLLMGAAAYFIICLTLTPIVKCIDKQDLENLKQIFSKIKILKPIATLILKYEDPFIAH
jgi:O-antigen/teichoic acid export membrane protein